ncbi:hypothetical protein KUTeg_007673 [Tegillarca granosa]|uniref:Uncharacterized protein n=1 Tax=Tegillarca granosa TaxID=220873 RepID=A0ABQ9FIF5_TEGGR|nr:hypothetical protein KUTeg_007673 [Tegillarca granosa]
MCLLYRALYTLQRNHSNQCGKMVDTQSRYRLYSYGYTPPEVRQSTPAYRDLYHEKAPPDKLLFDVGVKGDGPGDFIYPRGLTVTLDGDILVADTDNNRIQIFNQFGLYKRKFGTKGNAKGQFDQPTGVTEMPYGYIAVADRNNRRIQVFSEEGEYKYEFPTIDPPFCVCCDKDFNTAVSTTKRTIEIYNREGKLLHCFSIGGNTRNHIGCQISINNTRAEVIVCDTFTGLVKYFKYDGKLVYKFEPKAASEGLTMVPSAIGLSPLGDILVADALNHVVNVYSDKGVFIKQLLCPTDEAGAIQACAVGPEGHFIATEFSVDGPHSLKIFRYLQCVCHLTRPGSSKRSTPTQME